MQIVMAQIMQKIQDPYSSPAGMGAASGAQPLFQRTAMASLTSCYIDKFEVFLSSDLDQATGFQGKSGTVQ